MSRHVRLRHLPGRLTTGAFIVNSGLPKRHADDDTAAAVHGMADAGLFVPLLDTPAAIGPPGLRRRTGAGDCAAPSRPTNRGGWRRVDGLRNAGGGQPVPDAAGLDHPPRTSRCSASVSPCSPPDSSRTSAVPDAMRIFD